MPELSLTSTKPARPYRDKCPNCYGPLYYSTDADEQMCQCCFWMEGDQITGVEYPLSLSDWHVTVGLLWKQYKLGIIPYHDYLALTDQIEIANYK